MGKIGKRLRYISKADQVLKLGAMPRSFSLTLRKQKVWISTSTSHSSRIMALKLQLPGKIHIIYRAKGLQKKKSQVNSPNTEWCLHKT